MKPLNHLIIDQITLAPGGEWQEAERTWRFLRVQNGAAYWLGRPGNRPLASGETVVIAPGWNATIHASQLGPVSLQGFSFAPELLCGFFTVAERHCFETPAALATEPVRFLPSTHFFSQQFALLAARPAGSAGLAMRAQVLQLVALLFDETLTQHRLPPSRAASALTRFRELILQMPDAELTNHTPEQLARLCGCSPRHFHRLFREHFNTSPRARQTELRLLKARQLLTGTDDKVINVALASGYRSLSLFNAMFKQHFGATPSQWRTRTARKLGKALGALCTVLSMGWPFGAQADEPLIGIYMFRTVTNGSAGTVELENLRQALQRKLTEPVADPDAADINYEALAWAPTTNAPAADVAVDRRKVRIALRRKLADLLAKEQGLTASSFIARTNLAGSANTNTSGRVFEIKGYELSGNTLLPEEITEPLLEHYTGTNTTFETIRSALGDLQIAYRERGFVTVSVGLPPQQLTNGIVKVQVTEGQIADVTIQGQRYFTTNNIYRALPMLQSTGMFNGLVFQQQLDRANANRDRQIYPVISPGPEPGTSVLELKVKDRLPLHGRFALNNYATPGTPALRGNVSLVDNNLWQLEHQAGLQYSFTPQGFKEGKYNFYDAPLIANYSIFYRIPLAPVNGTPRDFALTDFGYDEVSRRFRAPTTLAASEIIFYASRSASDTGAKLSSSTLTPAIVPPEGGLQVSDSIYSRTLNPTANLGFRITKPLPDFGGIKTALSFGADYKSYRSTLSQDRSFRATLFVPTVGSSGPPFTTFDSAPVTSSRSIFTSAEYVLLNWGFEVSRSDPFGTTGFNFSQNFNLAGLLDPKENFQAIAQSARTDGRFYVLNAALTREQKLIGDWAVRLRADGQVANQPVISSEQFGLGGQAGVRGYLDGEEYGDSGWRATVEPHSPYFNLGMVDGNQPMLARLYCFADYGQRFLIDSGARQRELTLLGVGAGVEATVGEHFEFKFMLGIPLLDTPNRQAGDVQIAFSLGAQF